MLYIYQTTDTLKHLWPQHPKLLYKNYLIYTHDNSLIWSNICWFSFLLSGRPTTLPETMGKAEMWFIRTYWDFSFPRPRLPNVEFVGGLHCKPAKPLPKVTYSSFVLCERCVFSRNHSAFFLWNVWLQVVRCGNLDNVTFHLQSDVFLYQHNYLNFIIITE